MNSLAEGLEGASSSSSSAGVTASPNQQPVAEVTGNTQYNLLQEQTLLLTPPEPTPTLPSEPAPPSVPRFVGSAREYLRKWKGCPSSHHPPPPPWESHCYSAAFSFAVIAAICAVDVVVTLTPADLFVLSGSFGASAVLLYTDAALCSPVAQPWNAVVGHTVSAAVGVTIQKVWAFMGDPLPLRRVSAGLAVGLAVFVMGLTRSMHPPGGAAALIAVTGSDKIKKLGYLYVLFPIATGSVFMVLCAVVSNNVCKARSYPHWWW